MEEDEEREEGGVGDDRSKDAMDVYSLGGGGESDLVGHDVFYT